MLNLEDSLSLEGIQFNHNDQHFRCLAHVLNLGVQDVLKLMKVDTTDNENALLQVDDLVEESDHAVGGEESDLLNFDDFEDADSGEGMWITLIFNVRETFKKLRKSEVLLQKLQSFCEASDIKYIKPLLDIKTRWDSTFEMLNVACKLKKGLILVWNNCAVLQAYKIEESGWQSLVKLLKFLGNFKHVSKILSSETTPTLPYVVVTINLLLDNIEQVLFDLDRSVNRTHADEVLLLAIQAGRDKILKHYKKTNWIYCVSLILDPRHKLASFELKAWSKELKQQSYTKFINILKNDYCLEQRNETGDSERESSDESDEYSIDFKALYVKGQKENKQSWETEVENYLNSPREVERVSILNWWKENEKTYPRIAKMARDILSVMATSVPVERLFSSAGLILTDKRSKLSDEAVNALLCIKSWMTSSLKQEICKCNL